MLVHGAGTKALGTPLIFELKKNGARSTAQEKEA
jgi:hypothetical protein